MTRGGTDAIGGRSYLCFDKLGPKRSLRTLLLSAHLLAVVRADRRVRDNPDPKAKQGGRRTREEDVEAAEAFEEGS